MSYQILGLAGQQGAGKDYTYSALKELYGIKRRVMRAALADGVRREVTVEVLSAFPNIEIGDTSGAGVWAKPYTPGQRALLQWWGTEYRRTQDPDYWVKYCMAYIAERAMDGDLWVVTDVRFENEAEAIHLEGGKVALVESTDALRAERLGITEEELHNRSQHASEVIDFDTDFIIHNKYRTAKTVLDGTLLDWLGLNTLCINCTTLQQHIYHDNGEVFNG